MGAPPRLHLPKQIDNRAPSSGGSEEVRRSAEAKGRAWTGHPVREPGWAIEARKVT